MKSYMDVDTDVGFQVRTFQNLLPLLVLAEFQLQYFARQNLT